MIKRLVFFAVLWVAVDLYFYQGFRMVVIHSFPQFLDRLPWAYAAPDILVMLVFLVLPLRPEWLQHRTLGVSALMGYMIFSLVPKLLGSLVLLVCGLFSLAVGPLEGRGAAFVPLWMTPSSQGFAYDASWLATAVAAGLALAILYGMLRGGYRYQVRHVPLVYPDLPEAFDGLRITQLSDIHCGSFRRPASVRRGIALANRQQSDLIVFTGDLVNNKASELEGWTDVFSQLRAPMGCYAILGNHDYGDYLSWPDAATKAANLDQLKAMERDMGFQLLENQHVVWERSGQQLALIGVENWGKGRFPKYGDLPKAMDGLASDAFCILLSHDPSHWDEVVSRGPYPIALTLSGHTHGMQFGLEWGRLRWSPVQYIYPQWAGLYTHNGRCLYVNRGFGFLGFPGRVGIRPEITVLELRRS